MELRVLNYFLAVAREENFTKAAEQLHLTQPTLSRQIAQLEEELGVKLLQRSNHSILLTREGMILKRRAQELLALADKTKADFLFRGGDLEGTVSIGSGEFLATSYLTDCIATFRQCHPRMRYELYSGNADNIRDRIERGLLDMGLMSAPIDIRKYDFITMPGQEEWGILVREDLPLAQKEAVTPEDLAGQPLITAASEFTRSNVSKWLGTYGLGADIVATGNLLYNQVLLARSGLGVVVGIRLNCAYDGLRFVPCRPALRTGTVLAWKKEQVFSPATSAFIRFAKKYIQSIIDHEQ